MSNNWTFDNLRIYKSEYNFWLSIVKPTDAYRQVQELDALKGTQYINALAICRIEMNWSYTAEWRARRQQLIV